MHSFWLILSIPIVFSFGLFLCSIVGAGLKIGLSRVFYLYSWHTFFCIIYYFYSLHFSADSSVYYQDAQDLNIDFGVGTDGINFIVHLLVQYLNLSEVATFLVFNIFGVIGLLYFSSSMSIASMTKKDFIRKLSLIIVFLPSVSFWSSAIGKDSISFLAVSLALWAALYLRRRLFTMFAAIAIMLFVRPHMAAIMILAFTAALLIEGKISKFSKIFVSLLALGVSAIMIPFALNYAGLTDGANISELNEYIEERQGYNMEGGGGIDIGAMSLPEQMFAYVFRPSLLEVNSIFSLAAAFDNLILLALFFAGGYRILRGKYRSSGESLVFIWSYTMLAWIVLSMTTANMGIALRQKWMFVPFLVFLLISVMPDKKNLLKR